MSKFLALITLCLSVSAFASEPVACDKVEQILSRWYEGEFEKTQEMERMRVECGSWGGIIRPNSAKRIGSSGSSNLLGVICQLPKSGSGECRNVAQIMSGIYGFNSEKPGVVENMKRECESWGGSIKANSLKVTARHNGTTWLGSICELPQ